MENNICNRSDSCISKYNCDEENVDNFEVFSAINLKVKLTGETDHFFSLVRYLVSVLLFLLCITRSKSEIVPANFIFVFIVLSFLL